MGRYDGEDYEDSGRCAPGTCEAAFNRHCRICRHYIPTSEKKEKMTRLKGVDYTPEAVTSVRKLVTEVRNSYLGPEQVEVALTVTLAYLDDYLSMLEADTLLERPTRDLEFDASGFARVPGSTGATDGTENHCSGVYEIDPPIHLIHATRYLYGGVTYTCTVCGATGSEPPMNPCPGRLLKPDLPEPLPPPRQA